MRASVCGSVWLLAVAIPTFGQAIAEHAAAAAGSSMGVLAGKPASKALHKVKTNLDQAAKSDKTATKPDAPKASKSTAAHAAPAPSADPFPVQMPPAVPRTRRHQRSAPAAISRERDYVEEVKQPETAAVSARPDFSKVQQGMERARVLAVLGEPASRITIPDEGHLLEIFRFSAGSLWLGTVRLDNGAVVQVETAR